MYSEIWSALAASNGGGEILNRDGVLMISAGGKWPVMNTAFMTSPVTTEADLQDRILTAKRYYGPKKTLWLFISFNEWLDSSIAIEEVSWNHGLYHMQNCIGMQTWRLPEPRSSAPELVFRLVENDVDRVAFFDINADSYGFSPEWSNDIACWASRWPTENVRLYIAHCGNEAVSSAMVYLNGDVAYLGFVATRQGHQRQGYAEAIARYAMASASENGRFTKSILHSTPAGLSLYRGLGYSEVTTFGIYMGACE
ncbi:MAG: GNAT family N-acetyltransferase [Bryobacteraceae bacterium]